MTDARRRISAKLIEEIRNFFWIFLYLFIAFGFYTLADAIVFRREGMGFVPHGFAVINALVFGKVILVAEELRFGQWLRRGPLAYAIALESLAFTLLLLAVHFIERSVASWFRHGSPTAEPALGGGGWLGLLIVGTMMFFALIPFLAYRNLSRTLGPDRLHAIFFGARDAGERKNRELGLGPDA
jgi:hypothetical protein